MKRLGGLTIMMALCLPVSTGATEVMPTAPVIAEFPSSEFETSLKAVEATFERSRAEQHVGGTILLSAQSYEADGEQYLMYDATYRDGTFKFERQIPQLELVA